MKIRALVFCIILSSSLFGCSREDDSDNTNCPEKGTATFCKDGVLTTCINGTSHTETCTNDRICVNDTQCVDARLICDEATYKVTCGTDPHAQSVCKDGIITEEACPDDGLCQAGQCVPSTCTGDACDQATTCNDDDPVICDENDATVRLICVQGKRIPDPCPSARPTCSNGICQDASKPTLCGNRKIDGDDVCDYHDFGAYTCNNIESLDHTFNYEGTLTCSDDCSEITTENCVITTCGDGIRQSSELCDTGKDGKPIHSTFPTCYDYADISKQGLSYVSGGEPGCSRDCKGYSKGTCVIADQPRDGIEMCEFAEMTTYVDPTSNETWLQGKLNIVVDPERVDESDLYGRLVCGHAELQTYLWSFKASYPNFAVTDDDDGDPSTVLMNAWLNPTGWGPGTYDCAFQINAKQGSGGFYNCPIQMGYPGEEGFVTEEKYRQWVVNATEIVGDVIAHWTFESLGEKNDTVASAKAEEGANAASAVLTATAGTNGKTELKLLTGVTGFPTVAISADGWSPDTSLASPLTQKHFVVKFNTNGFENIRVQMYMAASGSNSGMVAATYTAGTLSATADNYSMKHTDRSWEPWSFVLDSAQNTDVTLNLYNYGNSDTNATWRIDELYILGDKIN